MSLRISKNRKLGRAAPRGAKFKRNCAYALLALPAVIWFLVFHYFPISGLILAFKNFNYGLGIFGSEWCGFENFKYFFSSTDAWVVLRNTIGYHLVSMILLSLFGSMLVALLLYEVKSRFANAIYQTSIILPNFISWIAVSYIALLLLNPESGIINQVLRIFGGSSINWYNEPKY